MNSIPVVGHGPVLGPLHGGPKMPCSQVVAEKVPGGECDRQNPPHDHVDGVLLSDIDRLIKVAVAEELERRLGTLDGRKRPAVSSDPGLADYVSIYEIVQKMPPGLRSESSVRRQIAQGAIPARKFGGRWCLNPAEVEAALKQKSSAKDRIACFQATWKAHEKRVKTASDFTQKTRKNVKCSRSD